MQVSYKGKVENLPSKKIQTCDINIVPKMHMILAVPNK